MPWTTENWKTQIRKGYLELCILRLIKQQRRVYGFDLIERLSAVSLVVNEGTIYPLLNRMSVDGLLVPTWDTKNLKGHPRKFYSLTTDGSRFLKEMDEEFEHLISIYQKLSNPEKGTER